MSNQRTSVRSNSTGNANARQNSGVRGGISKVNVARAGRRSSKGTPKSRRKNTDIELDRQSQMDCNEDQHRELNSSQHHEDQQESSLNLSSGSGDTVIVATSTRKKKLEKRPIEYFVPIDGGGKVKCSICSREYKHDSFSDTNLRSHLGFKHGLYDYLFPSQIKQRRHYQKTSGLLPHVKQKLDTAAIECIVNDGLPFGAFRRTGMSNFLETIKPGYRGPTRQTVRKRLDKMYQEKRSLLKETFKTIDCLSLTTDLWMNSRRNYFVVLTAHYLDKDYHHVSSVISFRRFCGRHLSTRLKSFLLNEIRKLNIESKIISITTDDGSDIKSATSSYEFGIRFSCNAHNINRTISNGLSLWKDPTSKRKVQNGQTTFKDLSISESQRDIEATRLIDIDPISDEWIDDENDSSDGYGGDKDDDDVDDDDDDYHDEDGGHDNDEDSTIDTNNDDDDDEESSESSELNTDDEDAHPLSKPQQDPEKGKENERDNQSQQIVLNSMELKNQVFLLLKKIRNLIRMIQKSSILTSFLRKEIQRKQTNLTNTNDSTNAKKIKFNDLVHDFCVRWNSTYLMLVRLLSLQQIVNDMTYSPQSSVGLTSKQVKKLRSLTINHVEWELVQALVNVLAPFYLATKCVSGRRYTTLSLSYWIMENLSTYLTTKSMDSSFESSLKDLLLDQFNYYFRTKVTTEQKQAKLVAAYLDPFTLKDLSMEEMNQAESLIGKEVKNSTNRLQRSSMTTSSSSSHLVQQHDEASSSVSSHRSSNPFPLSSVDQFRASCRNSTTTERHSSKPQSKGTPLSLKQELSVYVFTSKSYTDFQLYWSEKGGSFPILSSLVRRYCCIPTTSVASESAFSISGYVDRKERASLSPRTLRYLMLLK